MRLAGLKWKSRAPRRHRWPLPPAAQSAGGHGPAPTHAPVTGVEGRFWRDLVCLVGWHYWGRWDQPTAAADRYWQQRLCAHCGKAQVRDVG